MRKFDNPDAVLRVYKALREQLESPRASSGVLHSGLMYSEDCVRGCWPKKDRTKLKDENVRKGENKQPWIVKHYEKHALYAPVCRRCGREWMIERGDLRSCEVTAGRQGDFHDKQLEYNSLGRLIRRVPMWQRRVWVFFLTEEIERFADVAQKMYRPAGASQAWQPNGYDLLAAGCAREWKRKHVSEPGGFFDPDRCRALVKDARELMELKLYRAGLWEGQRPKRAGLELGAA